MEYVSGHKYSMQSRMEKIAINFDEAILRQLDKYTAKEKERRPGQQFTRSDAVRIFVQRGLSVEEKKK